MYNPNMNCNFIFEVRDELYFERSYIICIVELLKLIRSQLEVTEFYYRRIYEQKRSLSNNLFKLQFKILNMRVDFIVYMYGTYHIL